MNTPRVRHRVAASRWPLPILSGCLLPACMVVGTAALLPPGNASAQAYDARGTQAGVNTSDPSEVFLKAYTSVQQAEKLEQAGNLRPALAKYRFAASLLEQLTQTDPNWQTMIVRYRLRITTESIKKLEERGTLQNATPAPGTNPARADDNELPAPDNLPNTSLTPAPTPSSEELDRTVTDLKAKLAKTQKDLKDALNSLSTAQKEKKDVIAAAKKEKEEAGNVSKKERDELAAAKREKEETVAAAEKQRQNLEFELQTARSDAKTAQKRLERLKADRDSLQAQIDKAQERLKEITAKDPDAIQSRKELRAQVAELKKQLLRTQSDTDSAAKTRADFDAKLADGESRITALTRERDAAQAQVELTRDAAQKIESLQGENAVLTQKLSVAETRIAQLTEESVRKREELDGMQKELTGLKEQLTASRDQNDRSATTITELRQQLDEGAKHLEEMKAKGQTSEEFARMTKENELLRNIVIRQLKDQARRQAARKLLTDELARLDVQSATLNAQVEELGRPSVQLTDEERGLFKDPQVTIPDSESPTSVAVTIAAVKPDLGTPAPTATPAAALPGASPAPAATPPGGVAAGAPVADDHQTSPAVNNGAPRVETSAQPRVSEELLPMAREAKENFDRGHYVEAERTYDKLLSREPKNPYLLSNQGVVLFRQDKLKSAEVVLKKALAVSPKDAFCLATLGIVYYRMHRYDDALIYLTQAIQLDPRNATAHNYLGITSSQKGWPEAALEEIQKAIAINPNYADAHFNIAVIYATYQPPAKDRAQEHYRIATSLGATPDPTLEKLIQN